MIVVAPVPSHAVACGAHYTWVGGNGDWTDGSKWDPNVTGGPHDPTDCVDIPKHTVTLNVNVEVLDVTLHSGAISGTGALTVDRAFFFKGGRLAGTGTTSVGRTLTIDAGPTLLCGGRTLVVGPSAVGTIGGANGSLSETKGASIVNQGTVRIGNDWDINVPGENGTCPAGTGHATFVNTGTLEKTGGTGVSQLWPLLHNDDVVTASIGTLEIDSNSFDSPQASRGSFGATSSGLVRFTQGAHYALGDGASLAGGVSVGGTLDDTAAFLSVASGATVTTTGENWLRASSVTVEANSVLDITTGSLLHAVGYDFGDHGSCVLEGAGVTRVEYGGELDFEQSGTEFGAGHTVDVLGTAALADDGFVAADAASTFWVNGGTFDLRNQSGGDDDLGFFRGFGGGDFINDGLVVKSAGTGVSVVDATTSGSGTVRVDSGTLQLFDNIVHGHVAEDKTLGTGATDGSAPPGYQLKTRKFGTSVEPTGSDVDVDIKQTGKRPPADQGYRFLSYTGSVLAMSGDSGAGRVAIAIDSSQIVDPSARPEIFSSGALVPDCTGGGDADPCVLSRDPVGDPDGDGVRDQVVTLSTDQLLDPNIRLCCGLLWVSEVRQSASSLSGGVFVPPTISPLLGADAVWTGVGNDHLVETTALAFDLPGPNPSYPFTTAGTFTVADAAQSARLAQAQQTVRVTPQVAPQTGPASGSFVLTWASGRPQGCPGCTFDVQYRKKKSGGWGPWKPWGQDLTTLQEAFSIAAGRYQFRSDVVRGATASCWSPQVMITVLAG